MKIVSRIVVFAAPLAILLVLGVGGFVTMNAMKPKAEKAEEADRGLAIFTKQVEVRDIQLTVDSQGVVTPQREIAIAAQIGGRITQVSERFIEGSFIRRGDTIIKIDDADYRLAITRAKSQVASAEQRLARERAEADLARQDLDELGIEDASSLALREPQLAEATASLEGAKAQLRDAELALERTVVRAPFDGRIRSKEVDVGQVVSPGQSIGRMFGTDIAEVALPLTDADLGRLGISIAFDERNGEPGPQVILSADVAGQMREWRGRIQRTSAAVDPQTRLVSAIAVVEDPFGAGADGNTPLAPGLFVSAQIIGAMVEDVLVAPRAALRGNGQLYVADAETSKLQIKDVEVLFTDVDGVYMTGGVEPNALAVISPLQAAFDGMNINIADLEPAGTDGAGSGGPTVAASNGTTEG